MNNKNMIKKSIATALLATMTITGVGAFSADASEEKKERDLYGTFLQNDLIAIEKWDKEYEEGRDLGEKRGKFIKEAFGENNEDILKQYYKSEGIPEEGAKMVGYTKGILKGYYGN